MKKPSVFIPFFLLLISSCSAPKVANNEKEIFPEQFNFETKFRIPASAEEKPSISNMVGEEEDFQKILHSKDREQFHTRLQLRLDAIEEVYLRSKEALTEFDNQLNDSSNKKEDAEQFFKKLIDSGLYSKVLALRENNLSRQGQIIQFYKRFHDVAYSTSVTAIEREFSQDAFNYIGDYYKTLPRQYLVAHYQIALELSELNYENTKLSSGIQKAIAMKRSASDTLTDLFNHYQANYNTTEVQDKINLIAKRITASKTDVGDEIKKSAYMIQSALVTNANTRLPQSQKIEPSMGPAGNITGNSFPKGVWAITYDDGPHPVYTNQIVNNLNEFNIKSTFFSLSKNVVHYPKITNGIKEMGMEIANHSHDHPQLTKLNDTQLDFQILTSTDKITAVTGEKPKFFRCPYGAGTNVSRVRSRIAKEDMIHVFWSVDSLDWQDRNPASIVARVKKQISLSKKGGGVILFHDIHPQSVTASKEIMKYLKAGGTSPGQETQIKTIGSIVEMLNN